MSPMGEGAGPRRDDRFVTSDNVWVLIPLAALSIPILAVVGDSPVVWVIPVLAVIAAVTLAVRQVLVLHHRHRLEEIRARERLAIAERDRYTAVDRFLEREGVPSEPLDPERCALRRSRRGEASDRPWSPCRP